MKKSYLVLVLVLLSLFYVPSVSSAPQCGSYNTYSSENCYDGYCVTAEVGSTYAYGLQCTDLPAIDMAEAYIYCDDTGNADEMQLVVKEVSESASCGDVNWNCGEFGCDNKDQSWTSSGSRIEKTYDLPDSSGDIQDFHVSCWTKNEFGSGGYTWSRQGICIDDDDNVNKLPEVSNPNPPDGDTNVPQSPDVSIDVSDPEDNVDVTFYDAGDDSQIGSDTGVSSGSAATVNWGSADSFSTTYSWYAEADDGNSKDIKESTGTFSFTTESNDPPSVSNPSPSDGATGVKWYPTLSVDVSDAQGQSVDVTFYNASDNSVIGSDNGVSDGGTAEVKWSSAGGKTNTYDWYVEADDGYDVTTSSTWSFTTSDYIQPYFTNPDPSDGATNVSTSPQLGVDVNGVGKETKVSFHNLKKRRVVYDYTGGPQEFTVPEGVQEIDFRLEGAAGGDNGDGKLGGDGGVTSGTLEVSPGDTLSLYVGGAPTEAADGADQIVGGWNGGGWGDRDHHYAKGGGGGTDIRVGGTTCQDRIVVAGGGGGFSFGKNGGDGGGITGADGGGSAGQGGTQSSGGNQGGSFCSGGSNKDASDGTGAGGGGWYGGGRGSFDDAGGGGSGFCNTTHSMVSSCQTSRGGGGSGNNVPLRQKHGQIVLEYDTGVDRKEVGDLLYDSFEDGNINEWYGNTGSYYVEGGGSHDGSNYVRIDTTGNSLYRDTPSNESVRPQNLSFALRDGYSDHGKVRYMRGGKNGEILIEGNVVDWTNKVMVNGVKLTSVNSYHWYDFELKHIDWKNCVIGEVYLDGTLQETDLPFRNCANGKGYDTVRLDYSGGSRNNFRFDNITITGPELFIDTSTQEHNKVTSKSESKSLTSHHSGTDYLIYETGDPSSPNDLETGFNYRDPEKVNGGSATGTVKLETDKRMKNITFNINYFVDTSSTTFTEGFEDTTFAKSFTGDWTRTTADSNSGSYSYKSTNEGNHNSASSTEFTVDSSGTLSLQYRVSSEGNFDYGNIYINGNRKVHESGNNGWKEYSTSVSSGDTIKFEYTKDGSVSNNDDRMYVDDITLTQNGDSVTIYRDSNLDNKLSSYNSSVGAGKKTIDFTVPTRGLYFQITNADNTNGLPITGINYTLMTERAKIGSKNISSNGRVSVTWDDADEYGKNYKWYAKSQDGISIGTSEPYEFTTFDNEPPVMELLSPVDTFTLPNITFDLKAEIRDPDGDRVDVEFVRERKVGESGTIVSDGSSWKTVELEDSYQNPIVLATPNTDSNGNANLAKVRNVGSSSFELKYCEHENTDDSCDTSSSEEVAYLIFEKSSLDSLEGVEAGKVTLGTGSDSPGSAKSVNLDESFGGSAIVVAQQQTQNNPGEVIPQSKGQGTSSFNIYQCDHNEGSVNGCESHGTEEIGWVAIDSGSSVFSNWEAGRTSTIGNSGYETESFSNSYSKTPMVMATINSHNGGQDAKPARARSVTSSQADVGYCEHDSGDTCDGHAGERIAWIAVENGTGLYADTETFDSFNDVQTGNTVSTQWKTEKDGETYRWHAVLDDGNFTVQTKKWSFSTPNSSATRLWYDNSYSTRGSAVRNVDPEEISDFDNVRTVIVEENSGKDLENYSVKIELDSNNFDFSDARSDGGDIRIFGPMGHKLPVWVEKWDESDKKAVVWTNVPEIPAEGTVNLELHYGKEDAQLVSNGDEVFLWYDNFTQNSEGDYVKTVHVDRNSNTNGGWIWNTADSVVEADDSNDDLTLHTQSPGIENLDGIKVEAGYNAFGTVSGDDNDGSGILIQDEFTDNLFTGQITNDQAFTGIGNYSESGSSNANLLSGSSGGLATAEDDVKQKHTFELIYHNGRLRFYSDGTELASYSEVIYPGAVGLVSDGQSPPPSFNYLRASKHTEPEPSSKITIPVFDDFEDGDLTGWTVNDLSTVQNNVRSGDYAAHSSNALSGNYQARRDLSSAEQIKRLEFSFYETSASYGQGLRLMDSNNNPVLGIATNNPQWDISDANGVNQVYGGDGYGRWVDVVINFDWSKSVANVTIEDQKSGYRETYTNRPLKTDTNVKAIQLEDYNNGNFQDGGSLDGWWDNIRLYSKS